MDGLLFLSLQEILRTAELYSPVFAGHNATDADDVMANDLVGGLMSNVSCLSYIVHPIL